MSTETKKDDVAAKIEARKATIEALKTLDVATIDGLLAGDRKELHEDVNAALTTAIVELSKLDAEAFNALNPTDNVKHCWLKMNQPTVALSDVIVAAEDDNEAEEAKDAKSEESVNIFALCESMHLNHQLVPLLQAATSTSATGVRTVNPTKLARRIDVSEYPKAYDASKNDTRETQFAKVFLAEARDVMFDSWLNRTEANKEAFNDGLVTDAQVWRTFAERFEFGSKIKSQSVAVLRRIAARRKALAARR